MYFSFPFSLCLSSIVSTAQTGRMRNAVFAQHYQIGGTQARAL